MGGEFLFTSESVTEGHPDKIADQVSDGVLDAVLTDDPGGRVACETLITTGLVVVGGEITTETYVDIPKLVRDKITDIGYTLSEVRKVGELPYLRPDGKAQVTVRYEVDEHGRQRPVEIERVLISTQHAEGCDAETLIKPDLLERVLHPILPRHLYDENRLEDRDFVYVNPTGKFVLGGPMGDTGLTGRKIIVDTYGGAARHGGGAFSRKDPSKGDRSAPHAARHLAKN